MTRTQRIPVDGTETGGYVDLKALDHVIVPFIAQTVAPADIYIPFESGSASPDTRIVACAFQPVNNTDTVTAYPASATTVVFIGTGSGHSGYLHMWINR